MGDDLEMSDEEYEKRWHWYAFSLKNGVDGLVQIPLELKDILAWPKVVMFRRLTMMGRNRGGEIVCGRAASMASKDLTGVIDMSAITYLGQADEEAIAMVEKEWGLRQIVTTSADLAMAEINARKEAKHKLGIVK